MKPIFYLLLLSIALFSGNNVYSQKQIVCNGKRVPIDEKTTFVFDPKKITWNFVLNGKAIYLPKPEYPVEAKEKKLHSAVAVNVLIDENGDVISAEAVSGNEIFRKPAVEAVKKAKFKKYISDCKPKRYNGTVIFNFTGDNTEEIEKKTVEAGNVTKKAIYLPQPRVPFNIDFPKNETVRVKVLIDVLRGNVIEAKAISGHQKLRPFAEKAARCGRFPKTRDIQAQAAGYMDFEFTSSNRASIGEMNGGVLNGKAIFLPKPDLPLDIDAFGSVSVRVNLDKEGNVISAKAVSGNICLGEAAAQAAKKAKFSQTFLSGKPVKVSGIVVYNFPAKK